MKRNQKTAFVFSAVLLLIAVAYAVLYFLFIPDDPKMFINIIFILIIGLLVTVVANWLVRKMPDSIVTKLLVFGVIALLVASPFISASMKQITWSRFGFTVYGVVPIPLLDITVDQEGSLWFRTKKDTITVADVRALVNSETTVIVVAQGWDSVAQVDGSIYMKYMSVKIHELSTPEAFEKYNELTRQGVKVVLVGHTS